MGKRLRMYDVEEAIIREHRPLTREMPSPRNTRTSEQREALRDRLDEISAAVSKGGLPLPGGRGE